MRFSLCHSSRATFQPADQNDKAAAASNCSSADLLYVPGTALEPQLRCQDFLTLFPLYDCCTWIKEKKKNIFKTLFLLHGSTNLYRKYGHISQGRALSAGSSFQTVWRSSYLCRNPLTSSHHWVGLGEDTPDITIWSFWVTISCCCWFVSIRIKCELQLKILFPLVTCFSHFRIIPNT